MMMTGLDGLAWIDGINLDAAATLLARGGPIVVGLLFLSVISLSVALLKSAQFLWFRVGRKDAAAAAAIRTWRQGDVPRALADLKARRHPHAALVHAALAGKTAATPVAVLREDLEQRALEHLAGYQSSLRVLEAVSQLAPLIGLFGTVVGMMGAFQVLQASGSEADPSALAGGIWVALITTAVGLAVAIPAAFSLYWFEGRLANEQRAVERLLTDALAAEAATNGETSGSGVIDGADRAGVVNAPH